MSDLDSHLDAVASADPADTGPLLAYADWLAANGDPARGEFIVLQCPPSPDGSAVPRIRELFDAHGERWFAPAYELLRTAASVRPDADREQTAAAMQGAMHMLTLGSGVVAPMAAPPPDLSEPVSVDVPIVADVTAWGVSMRPDWTAVMERHPGGLNPVEMANLSRMSIVQVERGVIAHVHLSTRAARRVAAFNALLAREPVTHLTVALPPFAPFWQRLDSPLLRRVRHLKLTLVPTSAADEFDPLAHAVFHSPHLSALTKLELDAGWQMEVVGLSPKPKWTHARTAGVLERLTASPLWSRLTSLQLTSGGGVGWWADLPALADAPADTALEELTVLGMDALGDSPAPPPEVYAALARLPFASRLKKLHLHGLPLGAGAIERLFTGTDWNRLEVLTLGTCGLGDAGAKALAAVGPAALPALRNLDLSSNEIGDSGAEALAASPLFRQLRTLGLSTNGIRDAGARALATALDTSELRTLNLMTIGYIETITRPFGPQKWTDRILRWVTLPLWLPMLLLGRLFGGKHVRRMPLTAGVSAGERARLKSRYGNRILFGDEWRGGQPPTAAPPSASAVSRSSE